METMRYTTYSDVWSFAVVMLEIFTAGQTPYRQMSDNSAVIHYVMAGGRAPRPPACSSECYELMLKCWEGVPTQRPIFPVLVGELETLAKVGGGVVPQVSPNEQLSSLLKGQGIVIRDLQGHTSGNVGGDLIVKNEFEEEVEDDEGKWEVNLDTNVARGDGSLRVIQPLYAAPGQEAVAAFHEGADGRQLALPEANVTDTQASYRDHHACKSACSTEAPKHGHFAVASPSTMAKIERNTYVAVDRTHSGAQLIYTLPDVNSAPAPVGGTTAEQRSPSTTHGTRESADNVIAASGELLYTTATQEGRVLASPARLEQNTYVVRNMKGREGELIYTASGLPLAVRCGGTASGRSAPIIVQQREHHDVSVAATSPLTSVSAGSNDMPLSAMLQESANSRTIETTNLPTSTPLTTLHASVEVINPPASRLAAHQNAKRPLKTEPKKKTVKCLGSNMDPFEI
jgi:hypothetical protein